ncbi:hypothetical protein HanXRQr2_Chr00c071g0833641 [Helianthus annuus]|uniref:Uncharacterized protein n=1 Tax=Helianthus annuus TaxID=4232 RepID=A0A9K3K010_HELAN|nr:hypothetical protein HanXRQr2_Chr00c071g0833641 [Helianthus annuus]KAJ0944598.1 hypothetical protein HanPSC8_Chr03g0118601 [Helianthus annuus]
MVRRWGLGGRAVVGWRFETKVSWGLVVEGERWLVGGWKQSQSGTQIILAEA